MSLRWCADCHCVERRKSEELVHVSVPLDTVFVADLLRPLIVLLANGDQVCHSAVVKNPDLVFTPEPCANNPYADAFQPPRVPLPIVVYKRPALSTFEASRTLARSQIAPARSM